MCCLHYIYRYFHSACTKKVLTCGGGLKEILKNPKTDSTTFIKLCKSVIVVSLFSLFNSNVCHAAIHYINNKWQGHNKLY